MEIITQKAQKDYIRGWEANACSAKFFRARQRLGKADLGVAVA